jgi:hypothetical protein
MTLGATNELRLAFLIKEAKIFGFVQVAFRLTGGVTIDRKQFQFQIILVKLIIDF